MLLVDVSAFRWLLGIPSSLPQLVKAITIGLAVLSASAGLSGSQLQGKHLTLQPGEANLRGSNVLNACKLESLGSCYGARLLQLEPEPEPKPEPICETFCACCLPADIS